MTEFWTLVVWTGAEKPAVKVAAGGMAGMAVSR